ncbi:hypothetical protein GWK08_06935 [Leptobacterium flavescens]|uniref:Uncharacterized protein n=1 Tax=Leptobacterium flavescens TaxID=472055 RepID=A0A6P0UJL2_9FLAO|nr:hypothetical protein [Leptobacterium flavescens]NER13167.1 hypothetical protein [Leptobacterium flavescens]
MKTYTLRFLLFLAVLPVGAQENDQFPDLWFSNEVSQEQPYGKLDLKATPQLADYNKLIGSCQCKSVRLQPDGKWSDSIALKWRWKYIMNGNAVQDEGWYGDRDNPSYFTSVRVYDKKNERWYVTYFSPELNFKPDTWIGRKENGNIVLEGTIKTTGGELTSLLTFSDISDSGFNWEARIINPDLPGGGYSFWKIFCKKLF